MKDATKSVLSGVNSLGMTDRCFLSSVQSRIPWFCSKFILLCSGSTRKKLRKKKDYKIFLLRRSGEVLEQAAQGGAVTIPGGAQG